MKQVRSYGSAEARRALQLYESQSAATVYAIGYNYEGKLYVNYVSALRAEWIYIGKTSNGEDALKMYIGKKLRAALRNRGVVWGEALDEDNNGDAFERMFYEHYKLGEWNHNSVPFYERGDAEVGGQQVQIKFMNATVCKLSTLERRG